MHALAIVIVLISTTLASPVASTGQSPAPQGGLAKPDCAGRICVSPHRLLLQIGFQAVGSNSARHNSQCLQGVGVVVPAVGFLEHVL